MNIIDKTINKQLKEKTITVEELAKYLMDNYPAPALAMELAECLLDDEAGNPIIISMEEFRAHFRVKGTKWVDGQMVPDGRGSKRWG